MALDTERPRDALEPSSLTWSGSDRPLARHIARPMQRILHLQVGGGILMLVAAVVALVWANSPWRDSYHDLMGSHTRVEIGSLLVIDEGLAEWINDALMVVFFFVVGLEIKRELVVGQLRRPAAAALPAIAALGGMVVPAVIYAAFNAGGEGSAGWGIPMATDIAFAVGVVSLLGNRVPGVLKVFLLTLAIVDDIGAILVIAIFYTDDLSPGWLAVAVGIVALLVLLRLVRVWYTPIYLIVGVVFWIALFESGVHATIAGVIMGLFAPAKPLLSTGGFADSVQRWFADGFLSAEEARQVSFEARERVAVADRLANWLHPWTSFVIVPVFALANAGVELSRSSLASVLDSPVTIGIVTGLVVGKVAGISSFAWLAVRLRVCSLPEGATWTHVVGLSAVAGIGFTVSLFITNLAFTSDQLVSDAKIGILIASTIAALVGAGILRSSRPAGSPPPGAAALVGAETATGRPQAG